MHYKGVDVISTLAILKSKLVDLKKKERCYTEDFFYTTVREVWNYTQE